MTDVGLCRAENCERQVAAPGMSRCNEHRFLWTPAAPVQRVQPEWIRRRNANGLPPKDFTRSAA